MAPVATPMMRAKGKKREGGKREGDWGGGRGEGGSHIQTVACI